MIETILISFSIMEDNIMAQAKCGENRMKTERACFLSE